jgi:hypothetical protein
MGGTILVGYSLLCVRKMLVQHPPSRRSPPTDGRTFSLDRRRAWKGNFHSSITVEAFRVFAKIDGSDGMREFEEKNSSRRPACCVE